MGLQPPLLARCLTTSCLASPLSSIDSICIVSRFFWLAPSYSRESETWGTRFWSIDWANAISSVRCLRIWDGYLSCTSVTISYWGCGPKILLTDLVFPLYFPIRFIACSFLVAWVSIYRPLCWHICSRTTCKLLACFSHADTQHELNGCWHHGF